MVSHRVRVDEDGVAGQQPDAVALELLAHDRLVKAATTRAVRSQRSRTACRSDSSRRVGSSTSSGRCASWLSTAWRSVLDGIVPVWIETPPSPVAALGDGHPLAELGGLDRGALAAGAGADDQQVELHALGTYPVPRDPS